MIGKAIYNILSNDGDVSAKVSTRIYPGAAPQNAANPCIIYNLDTRYEDTKDNVAVIANIDVQIDIYTDGYDNPDQASGYDGYGDNDDIATKVIAALDRYSGTNSTFNIDKIRLTSRDDFWDNESDAYRTLLQFDARVHL